MAVLVDAAALAVAGVVTGPGVRLGVVAGLVTLIVLASGGQYRIGVVGGSHSRSAIVMAAGVVPAACLSLLAPAGSTVTRDGILAAVLLLGGRRATAGWLRMRRADGARLVRTIIVGGGQLGRDIASVLGAHPEYGLLPVGFVDDSEDGGDLPLPLLGPVRSLHTALREHMAAHVVVAYGVHRDEPLVPILRECQKANVTVQVIPRFFELGLETRSDEMWGLPLSTLRRPARRSAAWSLKRALDVVVAIVALILTAPLLGALALMVRMSGPGPILFRQERIGLDGRPFQTLKFRSMRINADSATCWSVARDPRVTRFGRFLRRTSMDELPQLFNVVRGDMSLVGPRPERPHFVGQFESEIRSYQARHRVPVGLTGWAQIHGLRGDTSIVERTRFDNRYIESWSLWRDLTILAKTIPAVLRDSREAP